MSARFTDQTMQRLFVQTAKPLSDAQAHITIRDIPGLIPIGVAELDGDKLIWADVKDYAFPEWRFLESLQTLFTLPQVPDLYATNIDLLRDEDLPLQDSLYPSGFIFHMAKCGSTLLARILERADGNLVVKEGSPLREASIWPQITEQWTKPAQATAENLCLLRRLILAMGRRRTAQYKRYFFKFTSYNVVFMELIRRAFPDVPCLFMYREPAEVIASMVQKQHGSLGYKGTAMAAYLTRHSAAETAQMDNLRYFVALEAAFLAAALQCASPGVTYLNYAQLTQPNLKTILTVGFDYPVPADQLQQMATQFAYYSKDEGNTTQFVADKADKQKVVTDAMQALIDQHLTPLYQQLEQSAQNLNRWF